MKISIQKKRFRSIHGGVLFLLVIALVPGAMAVSASAEAPVSIRIRPAATVADSRIYLKDIVQFCSDAELRKKMERIPLVDAPMLGKEKIIPGNWIASVLRSGKWMPDSVEISVPESVRVSRAFQPLPENRLKTLFQEFIADKIDGADFTITRFKVRGVDKLPVGRITFHPSGPAFQKTAGGMTLRLSVRVDEEESGWLMLSGWIDRYETVVCAHRNLPRKTVLEASDLKLERINISRAPADLVFDLREAVGKRLNRRVKAGGTIRQNTLSVPPLIQKGDRVKLIAKTGNLKIVTIGIAKGSGGAGEQIKIENISSKKTIVGRVKDASTVDVLF